MSTPDDKPKNPALKPPQVARFDATKLKVPSIPLVGSTLAAVPHIPPTVEGELPDLVITATLEVEGPATVGVTKDSLKKRVSVMDTQDYFEILSLEKTATLAEIKRAFHQDSRTIHPDRFHTSSDAELKGVVDRIYKRVTEAYYVLRDDTKRAKYLADLASPDRDKKLRYSEASDAEMRANEKREREQALGVHPKARQLFIVALHDCEKEAWAQAERNVKMALAFEPQNALYKEKLSEIQKRLSGK